MTMNFEQLLEGANDPNDLKATMIWGLAQQRMSPDVMREVWAALKDSQARVTFYYECVSKGTAEGNVTLGVIQQINRALALLDGQQPSM